MTGSVLLDEMYPPALAQQLRELGHDVLAVAAEAELVGADDATVLSAALEQRRVLVTENVRDCAILTRQRTHHGMVFVNGQRWPRTPAGIPVLLAALATTVQAGNLPGVDEVRWLA